MSTGTVPFQKIIPSQEDVHDMLEAACEWAFITDSSYRITYCHKSRTSKDTILPHNLVGKPFVVFLPENQRKTVMAFLTSQSLIRGGRQSMVYHDNYTGAFLIENYASFDESGFTGCKILISKFSREEYPTFTAGPRNGSARDREIRTAERQEIITELSLWAAGDRDIHTMLTYTVQKLGDFLDADRCSVFIHDSPSKTYRCKYQWCAPGIDNIQDIMGNIPYNAADDEYLNLTTRPYIAVGDTSGVSGETFKVQRELGIGAFLYLPVTVGEDFWGFIGAETAVPRNWDSDEIRLFQTIGNILSVSIEKRRMREDLYEAFTKLDQIVKGYPGIIWSLDTDRTVTLCEGLALKNIIPPEFEPVGKNIRELFLSTAPEPVREGIENTFSRGPQSYVMNMGNRDFTVGTGVLRSRDGEVTGMVGVALDITEMKAMQRELEAAMAEAQRANSAKSEFLSRMSHEIRTPMNAIIGMADIARATGDMERIRYCLDSIGTASRQLLQLINDILDISKIESGKLEIASTEFDFDSMLQNILSVIRGKIDEKNQTLKIVSGAVFSRRVISDDLRLSQVLLNLLSNAVKFTPEGGTITLTMDLRSLRKDTALLHAEVRDTGIGIRGEDQAKLFTVFEQADGSITRKYGGTGLGLAICRKIMDLMGGTIRVESEPGKGAAFIFEVPIAFGETITASRPEKPARDPGRSAAGPAEWKGKTLLLAEDIEINKEIITGILEYTGVTIDWARNGEEAVRFFAADTEKYDLILMDIQMPVMDGLSAAERIRAIESIEPEIRKTPIVAMTANAFTEDVDKCLAAGMDGHLAKPVDVGDLMEKLKTYL
ncbi:GAF domain-containing hybrid sensor histidine kinase/response regulator [Breznakiella homolactica]|uniref:histidine kinase n=1 Tax=Breznakiella homolactica TaxID=2798577 RepID=A0A7T7XKU8_9SPIR|nr:ATP-binding protein [Breznakiella homolactica]QQO08264.1 response regulator [Breznakiella homolactica]